MANEIIFKKELGPILNTLIGETPKTLPAVLNKGDVVKYGNYLYKYKGENGVRKELVDEGSFKKVGLRYRENEYKVDIVDSMENLYKWMYETGLNGDKQKSEWQHKNLKTRSEYKVNGKILLSGSRNEYMWSDFKRMIKDSLYDAEHFFNYPIRLSEGRMKNFEFLERNPYNHFETGKGVYDKYVNYEHVSDEKIKKEAELFYNKFEKILESETLDYEFYRLEERSLESYKCFGGFLKRNGKYGLKKMHEKEFEFGVFQDFFKNKELKIGDNKFLTFYVYTHEYKVFDEKRKEYYLRLEVEDINIESNRFWLPYFNDMEGKDYSGNSARILNRDFNKYGIYFKLEDDGNYVYRFKSVFTDRNQHEEWGTKGPWGARYAYYLSETDVRGDGDTYCRWQPKEIETELNFTIENGNIINVSLNFSEETRDTNRFKDEFMNTGYTFENGYLYIKVFYAIWSYDDSGNWNEWQFAHVIPPFSLEFKGE